MVPVPVSILIPIKNEAANLPRCLASVAWADEVFVVDSQSTDASAAIVAAEDARRRADDGGRKTEDGGQRTDDGGRRTEDRGQRTEDGGLRTGDGGPRAHLVQFHFNGTWPKKQNWALDSLPFRHEWVFILAADEVLPPEAESEIRGIVESSNLGFGEQRSDDGGQGSGIAGYWINRRFMFMGRWLKHAYYPNWNMRLFKHRWGRYEKLTDAATASGDIEIHEHIVLREPSLPGDGVVDHPRPVRTGRMKSEMDHYAFPSVEAFVEKHNRYSNWEARVALDRHLGASAGHLQSGGVAWRRRLKMISHRLPFRPMLRFCYVYLWQRGFLDGVEGYYFARLHAMYELLCIAKERELRAAARR